MKFHDIVWEDVVVKGKTIHRSRCGRWVIFPLAAGGFRLVDFGIENCFAEPGCTSVHPTQDSLKEYIKDILIEESYEEEDEQDVRKGSPRPQGRGGNDRGPGVVE